MFLSSAGRNRYVSYFFIKLSSDIVNLSRLLLGSAYTIFKLFI